MGLYDIQDTQPPSGFSIMPQQTLYDYGLVVHTNQAYDYHACTLVPSYSLGTS